MPTYQLKCKECGHIFDTISSYESMKAKKCENCGGETKSMPVLCETWIPDQRFTGIPD